MASSGQPGGSSPGSGSHPRMSAQPPIGPGSSGTERTRGQGGSTQESFPEQLKEMASGMSGRLGDAWQSTSSSLREGAQRVARQAQDFWADAGNLVRRNPMAAIAVAFGVGCLFGSLVSMHWSGFEDDVAERMSRSSAY